MKSNDQEAKLKIEQTTDIAGELVHMNREDILKLPMKGKVQYPYKQPYDRHPIGEFMHDQTDRAGIARYSYKDIDAYILKKLSGREYSWGIYNEKGNRDYGDVYIDRENKGDEFAISIFIPQIEAVIDQLS